MKKFLFGVLVVVAIVVAGISGMVFAGEKANVVVTDSAGKAIVMKSVTVTSGSSSVTASGLGTVTGSMFMKDVDTNGSTSTFATLNSGSTARVYAYDPVTGGTGTTNHTGTLFIWGTP